MSSHLLVYDHPTLAAYRRHAGEAIESWRRAARPSQFLRRFVQSLPARARVLDYGCGIGTDLAWLRRRGFRVEGLDGTPAFLRQARRRCPGVLVREARFETVHRLPGSYDGIWCQAALIHVTPDVLRRQLAVLREALSPSGLLGLSLAWGRRKGLARRDWIPGRYVAGYTKPEAMSFFRQGWVVHECRVVSHDGRQGRWIQLLARPQ